MQFGADQSSEVQWVSCMVLSSSIQGSAASVVKLVKSSSGKDSLVQLGAMPSSLVFWNDVRLSPLQSTPLMCTPVQFNPVQSIKWSLFPSFPIQFRPVQIYSFPSNSIHSLPPKYISI